MSLSNCRAQEASSRFWRFSLPFCAVAMLLATIPSAPAALALDQGQPIATSIDAEKLDKGKRTKLGLYVTATEAAKALENDKQTILIDVRARSEVNFLGMPTPAAANIPLKEVSPALEYDAKKKSYKMIDNPDFADAVDRLVQEKGLAKDAPIVLMCRSGSRSAKAADILAGRGYTKVYSMVDGFEGDKAKDTKLRTVNGWKNSGLPYTLDVPAEKAYQPKAK